MISGTGPDPKERTPKTWAENVVPLPSELAEWLAVCTEAERLDFAVKALDAQDRAHHCFMEDHDGLREELTRLQRLYATAYDDGWKAAGDAVLTHLDSAEVNGA